MQQRGHCCAVISTCTAVRNAVCSAFDYTLSGRNAAVSGTISGTEKHYMQWVALHLCLHLRHPLTQCFVLLTELRRIVTERPVRIGKRRTTPVLTPTSATAHRAMLLQTPFRFTAGVAARGKAERVQTDVEVLISFDWPRGYPSRRPRILPRDTLPSRCVRSGRAFPWRRTAAVGVSGIVESLLQKRSEVGG